MAFGAMEQFHENKQIRTKKAFFLPNGIKYGKILVTSFIEAIVGNFCRSLFHSPLDKRPSTVFRHLLGWPVFLLMPGT